MIKILIMSVFSAIFQIFLILSPTPSSAIDTEIPSWTAEVVAAQRALGAYEEDVKVRNPDYLAEKFVSPIYWHNSPLELDDMRKKRSWRLRTYLDVGYYFMTARTKHFDAILKEEGVKEIRQVVNLGVGYDTRAYRYHDAMPNVKYFELDTKATIDRKKEIVAKIFGALPSYVVYIAIDFDKQSLEDALLKAGYDKTQKTLFIWEGVTMYLTKEAVDGTLKFIAEQSAPGSSVVFDYCLKSVIEGDYSAYLSGPVAKLFANHGEPFVYGIDPKKIRDFLKDRKLELISDIGPEEMEKMYLIRSDGAVYGKMSGYERITHAVITKKQ
jgi:methyltransferase (TIGR00027 family)